MIWGAVGGLSYYGIEGIWRIPSNGGWANVSMLFVGGICFVLVGGINQIPEFYYLPMRRQALIGAGIVLIVEFFAGCVLNIWLGLGIWDYSQMPFNLLGQVCLLYGVLWVFLMPLAIWLEDRLNLTAAYYKMAIGEEIGDIALYDYSILCAYRELLMGK